MSNLRLWILLLACTAFGAGLGVGWFASNRTHSKVDVGAESGPFEGFQREFARTFKISKERERLLAELLASYQREIDGLEEAQLESGRSDLEKQLVKLGLTYQELIRNSVLPSDQRSEYDRLAFGLDWKSNN
ncbi:MAG TPA: hypothetical protein VM509_15755 [Planctomycetota bacterium]|nr:hypothetical protein [Planctomycetota bacterium]